MTKLRNQKRKANLEARYKANSRNEAIQKKKANSKQQASRKKNVIERNARTNLRWKSQQQERNKVRRERKRKVENDDSSVGFLTPFDEARKIHDNQKDVSHT